MITSADIVFYGSQNMNRSDATTPQGGGIDETIKVVFNDMTQVSTIDFSSDSAGDTGNITIEGRRSTGSIITETIALNGLTPVTTINEFERILRITTDSHNGTIEAEVSDDGSGIVDIESGILEVRRPFLSVTGEPAGGSARTFYEKIFLKNNSLTNDYLDVSLAENFDGVEANGADVTFDIESVVEGTGESDNRITSPPTGELLNGVFNDTTKSIPGTDLLSDSYVGVWLRLNIPAGTNPINTNFEFSVSGATT
jgi:hypothetical protein